MNNADSKGHAPGLVWKARPIFISSTFRDMHAERDHLRNNAFLRLAEQLRDRCHYLDTIDLRQGVENASEADEAKREMQVLKVCLDEIERSKPFLVALLGDRYGWRPPPERIIAAARDAGLPPTLDVAGKSVTELEILYGVLENPGQRMRSWFYFRTLDRTGMPPEVAARFPAEEPSDDPESPAGRLRELKDRIRREMPDRVREYTLRWDAGKEALVGLREFDDQVAHDLWGDLAAETTAYLREAPRTWQEADARAVADFVAERIRGYVERPAVSDPMLEHALSPAASGAEWALVVTGESGGGKSSIFGRVYEALRPRAEKGEIVLLAHAAGIFPMSGQVDRMLKRWITELAAHLGIPDPLDRPEKAPSPLGRGSPAVGSAEPQSPLITSEEVDKTFASLLGQAAIRNRIVVLVDALNQFEPTVRAQYMTWLPKLWPDNARFIATAIPCQATSALTERPGCRELPVPPVSRDEARLIAERFYRERHHRGVNPRVLTALLDKNLPVGRQAHGNPLWLALALQEMNLLEADDFERADREFANLAEAARMEALQLAEADKLPADTSGVYGELLGRAERGFGKAWVDAFTGLTAISRAGWRESDLKALMPVVSGQPWDDLAFAGLRRIMGKHVIQRGAHSQWDFFHANLRDALLQREFADGLARRRLHGLIANQLLSLSPDDPLRESETMFHLIEADDRRRAALFYGGGVKQEAMTQSTVALGEFLLRPTSPRSDQSVEWVLSLVGQVSEDVDAASHVCWQLTYSLKPWVDQTTARLRRRFWGRLAREYELLKDRGPEGSSMMQTAVDIYGEAGPSMLKTAWSWRESSGAARCYTFAGQAAQDDKDYQAAFQTYRKAAGIVSALLGQQPDSPGWLVACADLALRGGDVLRSDGDLDGALEGYHCAATLLEDGGHARETPDEEIGTALSKAYCRLGDLEAMRHEFDKASYHFRSAAAILRRHLDVAADSTRRLGNLLREPADEAIQRLVRGGLDYAEERRARLARNICCAERKLGAALFADGNMEEGGCVLRGASVLAARLLENTPQDRDIRGNAALCHRQLGDVLMKSQKVAEAKEEYRIALHTLSPIVDALPSTDSLVQEFYRVQKRMATRVTDDEWIDDEEISIKYGALSGLTAARIGHMTADILGAPEGDDEDAETSFGEVGRAGEASPFCETTRPITEELRQIDSESPDRAYELWVHCIDLGDARHEEGRGAEALQFYERARAIAEELRRRNAENTAYVRYLWVSHTKLGSLHLELKDGCKALSSHEKAQGIAEELRQRDPENLEYARYLWASYIELGDVCRGEGERAKALSLYEKAVEVIEALGRRNPESADWARDIAMSYMKIAGVSELTAPGDARVWWRKTFQQFTRMKARGIASPADVHCMEIARQKVEGVDGGTSAPFYRIIFIRLVLLLLVALATWLPTVSLWFLFISIPVFLIGLAQLLMFIPGVRKAVLTAAEEAKRQQSIS
ncbi:MAG: DUF4062 domain-containing protein [Phycisphaerae bacterium]|nr:DUF4062 domain-containing protein [Phycisphaerae bacterium]